MGTTLSARPEFRIVIAGVVAELFPLAVGHLEFGDIERVQLHHVDRPLARIAVAEVIAHAEGSGGHVNIIAVAIVDHLGRTGGRGGKHQRRGKHKQEGAHVTEPPAEIRPA